MLQVENKTPFVATLSLFPDETGVDSICPIVKATFNLNGTIEIAQKQVPVIAADEYLGEPGESSIVRTYEIGAPKPATDVLMTGHAYANGGQTTREVDVSLSIDGKRKVVRVFGDRAWKDGFFGESISDPEPFDKMPLVFERAFGGKDITKKGEEIGYDYNTIGQGYRHPKGTRRPESMPLPNLEDPKNLIKRSVDKPRPSCFGPCCPNWLPRLQHAGTYDEVWLKERAPYLPNDFDPRFYNVAAPDLIFDPYLQGGEQIDIENATPEGRLKFKLPKIEHIVRLRIEGSDHPVPVNLDTVFFELDELRITMIWRGRCQCDKKMLKMELATFEIGSVDPNVRGLS